MRHVRGRVFLHRHFVAKLLGFSVEFVRSRVLHPRFWGPNYLGLVCGMFAVEFGALVFATDDLELVCDTFAVESVPTFFGADLIAFSVECVGSRVLHPDYLHLVWDVFAAMFCTHVWRPKCLDLVCDKSGSSEGVTLDVVSLVSRLFLLERCV